MFSPPSFEAIGTDTVLYSERAREGDKLYSAFNYESSVSPPHPGHQSLSLLRERNVQDKARLEAMTSVTVTPPPRGGGGGGGTGGGGGGGFVDHASDLPCVMTTHEQVKNASASARERESEVEERRERKSADQKESKVCGEHGYVFECDSLIDPSGDDFQVYRHSHSPASRLASDDKYRHLGGDTGVDTVTISYSPVSGRPNATPRPCLTGILI